MIEVLSAGLYTTVQDLGRYGYRSQGVPLSGAMDREAAKLANGLIENEADSAVLEMTMQGPELKFNCNTKIAITGAEFEVFINNEPMNTQFPTKIEKGNVLKIGKVLHGVRGYLAVSGGFDTEQVLGSRSFYNGITSVAKLEKGDVLPVGKATTLITNPLRSRVIDLSQKELKVFRGPEFHLLNENQRESLLHINFSVNPQSNRMAYVLHQEMDFGLPEIRTVPVQPGTVQVTPSGKWVVLMRDAQVTGGYPRILQLTESSIDLLAQKRGGEMVRFRKLN